MFEGIDDRSAQGIAAAVRRLVVDGTLAVGTRLPTVRAVASELGVSPTTVSEAWQSLSAVGIVQSRGRNGTVVLGRPDPVFGPRRYRRVTQGPGRYSLDLSTGTPDPALLPDLGPALARAARSSTRTISYVDEPVLDALGAALESHWPFPPGAVTVVDGAMDALDRIAAVVVRRGDRVLVENPTFAPLLDLLEQLGAEVVGLDTDAEGVVVESLARELVRRPTSLFLQPRAHNPTGVSMSAARVAAVAEVLASSDVVVVEDDHSGDIATAPALSTGTWRPDHTVCIVGFSKSYGPDLRLAAIGGAARIVEAVATRRILGPGWSSRLLQGVLADLLTDDVAVAMVADARRVYDERRRVFVERLAASGVRSASRDGINVWVEVEREQDALVALAAHGIGAAPGSPFIVHPLASEFIRLTIAALPSDPDEIREIADQVVDALVGARSDQWQRPS